jgi:hypothetical protein
MSTPKSSFRTGLGMLVACLVLSALPATSAAQTYVFNTAEFATGHNPQGIANGDFNADGIPDLVVANYNDNTVSVFVGTMIRTYEPGVIYDVGPNPIAIAVADFNGDGKLDLAVVNNNCPTLPCAGPGSVSVLLGNGDGTFQTSLPAVTVGNNPTALAFAPFITTTTALDIVVTNSADNTASVLIGNNTGGFTVRSTLPTGNNPIGIVAADFNLDGKPDMVIANNVDSTITYYLGTGTGTFTNPFITKPFATGPNPVGICIADFNSATFKGLPVPSIALADAGSSTISILTNRSPGAKGFNGAETFTVAGPATQLVCTDLNNQAASNLVPIASIVAVIPSTNQVSVLFGNGAGNFQPHVDYATGTGPSAVTTTQPGLPSFTGSVSPGIAVVNGTDDTVEVFPGAINGAFQMPQSAPTSYFIPVGNQPAGLGTADYNGDGKMDIAVADRADNNVVILLGNGDGTFTVSSTTATTGSSPVWVATGDLNGDGFQDMVTANSAANTLSVLLGKGDGTFQPQSTVTTGKKPVCVVIADFDNDGKLDLAVANMNDPSIEIFIGNGDGTFTKHHTYGTGTGSMPNQIAVGDFNNDSKLDLAIAGGGNNSVMVLLGMGTGLFQTAVNYAAGTNPTGVAAADFNNDGFLDLAVANNGSSTVSILLGNGSGTFPTHVDYPTATTPYFAFAEDFNGDSKKDVVVSAASTISDRISVMLGNGDGTLQPHVDHASVSKGLAASQALAIADFNGDGSWDIATADQLANNVTVYLNTAVPGFTPGSPINFGGVNVNSSSQQTITLNNPGSAPLENLAISTSGSPNYTETNTCTTSVVIGGSCSVTVTFTPTQPGTIVGTLNFNDNSLAGQQVMNLTGAGNGATATLNTNTLTFPVTLIRTNSPSQQVTITNNGNENLTITSIVPSGNFSQSNNCGSQLIPGATCDVNVVFTPLAAGPLSGILTITDNASNSPQTVGLSGTGTAVQLVPNQLNFGNQTVGTTSQPQTVTLTNKGQQKLTFTGNPPITIGGTNAGDFAQTNTCPGNQGTLGSGASCTFSVTFTPLAKGNRTASVQISDNGGGSPQLVPLTGTGQ